MAYFRGFINAEIAVPRLLFTLGVLCWIAAVAFGFVVIERYSIDPGKPANAGTWPSASALSLDKERATLLFFAHPLCPCTRSCLEELGRTLARHGDDVAVSVIFTLPRNKAADWKKSTLYQHALHMKGVTVLDDVAAEEAKRFGVYTSGTILLYDSNGRLMFNGGITAARGHEGDNDGRAGLERVLREGTDHLVEFPVFGCGLVEAVPGS